jgi:mRNA-degrading endonuclease RelE of RelBE toxin-antitoxin system
LLAEDRSQISEDLVALKTSPYGRPPGIKRFRGFGFPLYRLRSGTYRVLYCVDAATVTVMRVIDRKDLDRTLRQLGMPRR